MIALIMRLTGLSRVVTIGGLVALAGSTFTIAAIPAGRSVLDLARIVFNRWA